MVRPNNPVVRLRLSEVGYNLAAVRFINALRRRRYFAPTPLRRR